MADSYHMIGGDGQTYGPIARSTLQEWIFEGRVCPATKVRSAQDSKWRSAGEFSEFIWPDSSKTAPKTVPGPSSSPPPDPSRGSRGSVREPDVNPASPTEASASDASEPVFESSSESDWSEAANITDKAVIWLYWIGGFTLLDVLLFFTASEIGFAIATSVTALIHAWVRQMDGGGLVLVLGLDGLVLGTLALLTWLARYRVPPAFLIATILYVLDGLLALYLELWLSVAVHVFVGWRLYAGYRAALWLHQQRESRR